jgi:hypothetical protein
VTISIALTIREWHLFFARCHDRAHDAVAARALMNSRVFLRDVCHPFDDEPPQAAAAGFKDLERLRSEKAFEKLRKDPKFTAVMATIGAGSNLESPRNTDGNGREIADRTLHLVGDSAVQSLIDGKRICDVQRQARAATDLILDAGVYARAREAV